ncbi:MAG: YfcC family protein [Ruaniaceae bacterium]|nr:YfcC family protein [Ruaniaceae bacterium]
MSAADVESKVTPEKKPKKGFPGPWTILLWVILGVWLMTFILPSGNYRSDEAGNPIPGSFETVDLGHTFMDRLVILLESPVNALYGVRDLDTLMVGPWNVGFLFGTAPVFLFILAIGGFMTVVFKTNALNIGISHLARRFSTRGPLLIIMLCVLFGILGSVMSWSDETLGFYALMIPLMLGLGYDRLVVVGVVTVAPFMGIIGSTVNPFRIGVASDRAGVTMGDGIVLRLVILVVVMAVFIWWLLRYAKKVKADPSASLIGFDEQDMAMLSSGGHDVVEPLTKRHNVIIGLVAFTFALMTFSIIPWGAILGNAAANDYTGEYEVVPFAWELGWWLPEMTVLFLVMAIVIGMVGRLGEREIGSQFLQGVADFSGPAALVVLAKSVSIIMTNTQTIDTILSGMEGFVAGRSSWLFILLLAIVSVPLGIFVGSGSAGMALVMPILAPLGDFAGVDRSLVISTYATMGAWLNLLLPFNALLIAGLALARVGFNVYIKWIGKIMGVQLGIVLVLLLVGLFF